MTVAIGDLGDSIDEYLDRGETDAVGLWEEQKMLVQECTKVVDYIQGVPGVPKLKSRVIDLCDAGPGVGITNEDVIYRVCEEFIICGYD